MPTSMIQPAPPRRPRNSFLGRSLSDFASHLGIPSPVVESAENPFAKAIEDGDNNSKENGNQQQQTQQQQQQQQQQQPPFYKAFRRKSSSSSATSAGLESTTGASSKLALHKISSSDSPPVVQEAIYKTTFPSARDSPKGQWSAGPAPPTGALGSSSHLLDDGPDLPAPIPVIASPGRPISPRYGGGSHSLSSTPPIPEEDWSEQQAHTPPLLSTADFLLGGSPSTWDANGTELMSPSYFDNQSRHSRPSFSVPGARESPRWSGGTGASAQRTQSPYRVETRGYSAASRSPSRSRNPSPVRITSHSPERRPPSPLKNAITQPFNFQSVDLSASPVNKPSQRRGHRYKHSSVSINFFLEPPVRQPLAIPLSLPVPTLKECIQSMSREQKIRFGCCVCHFLVAVQVSFCAHNSMALTALSHLILYDAMGALLCVSVDVISNFDVWRESSIRHPFGLERVEVLAGLAMSVMLVFMSLDIASHVLETAFTGALNHHRHGRDAGQHFSSAAVAAATRGSSTNQSVNVPIVLACIVTLISAVGLKNHQRIGRALRPTSLVHHLPSSAVLTNPSHLITLSCCISLLLLPFTPAAEFEGVDTIVTLVISIAMCLVGCRLAIALGGIVMLSNPFPQDIDKIGQQLQREGAGVIGRPKVALWQVHHDLFMANIKIQFKGNAGLQSQLRSQAVAIVNQLMSKRCNASPNIKWETTIEIEEVK